MKYKEVILGEHVNIISGFAFDSKKFNEEVGMPLIRIRNLLTSKTATLFDGDFDKKYLITQNDLLIGMDGDFNIAKWSGVNALLNQRMMKIEPKQGSEVNIDYIYYILKPYLKNLNDHTSCTTVKHLSVKDVSNAKFALPPLKIQKKIAAVLDKADGLRQKRKQVNAKLDEFLQSVFLDMFGDPVRNPKGWEIKKMKDIAEIIMGQSPNGDSYNNDRNGEPLLNGPTEFGKKYPIEKQWTTEPKKFCQKDDILFCVRGATAGRMNFADKQYCIGRGLAAIRAKEDIGIGYIHLILRSLYQIFQSTSNGSTFINISKDDLGDVCIPITEIKLQNKFAQIVEKVEDLKKKNEASAIKLDDLFNSLLQRAFKGELEFREEAFEKSLAEV